MAKKVDEVRYDVNNNWTEILDASGKVTSIECTYEEFSGSVKKAVNLASNTTGIKSLEPNTNIQIDKDVAVPEDNEYGGGEICDWVPGATSSGNVWIVMFDQEGDALVMVMKDQSLVATGSQLSGNEATKLADNKNAAIVYERGSYQGEKNNAKYYAIVDKSLGPVIKKKKYKIKLTGEESVTEDVTSNPPPVVVPAIPSGSIPQNTKSVSDVNTAKIKNRSISLKVSQAPTTIQNLRAKIIFNAIQFAREMQQHKFAQLGEIIRVCTALGIERAYLRGYQHPVKNELNIDQCIYRFDLRGCLPFVDRNTNSVDPTKLFFTPKGSTLMLFCVTNKNETFTTITRDETHFVDPYPDRFETANIQSEIIDNRLLPEFAMIPKYATSYIVNGTDYICEILNNEFEFGDRNGNTCLTSINVASSGTIEPEPNMLVPINMNPFPYMTPNASLSYHKSVYPAPIPVRMVMDGVPLSDEDVIIANRFKLSGTTKIDPGVPIVVKATKNDQITTDVELTDGIIRIPPGDFSPNEIPNIDYNGPGVYILDPVVGTDTKFTEELKVGDIVELVNDGKQINGKFFTIGDDNLYYEGEELIEFFEKYGNISVVMDGWTLALSSKESFDTLQELRYSNRIYSYNAKFRISSSTYRDDGYDDILKQIDMKVTFIPDPINLKVGKIRFENMNPKQFFEPGEIFQLSEVSIRKMFKNPDGTVKFDRIEKISNVEFSFGGFEGDDLMVRCFSLEQHELPIEFNATLTRNQKTTRFYREPVNAFYQKHWIYHRVAEITNDTEMTLFPDADISFNGNLYRVGFNIHSASQNPGLVKGGLGDACAIQFQKKGEIKNSDTFFMPAATSEKVVIYESNEIETVLGDVKSYDSSDTVYSAKEALGNYNFKTVNYKTFESKISTSFGKPIYETTYSTGEHFQELDLAEIGMLYFNNIKTDLEQVTLETVDHIDFSEIANGFGEDDALDVRIVRYEPERDDDPYGRLATRNDEAPKDYHDCGLGLDVVEIISPYRFTVDNLKGNANTTTTASFFDYWEKNDEFYLTVTNGKSLEYWQKYFDDVYFDGTVETYDGDGLPTRSIQLTQKFDTSDYIPNYNSSEIQINNYPLGSSPLTISTGGQGYDISSDGSTSQGLFLLSIEDEEIERIPPNLLDVFPLRAAMFEGDED
jgi:hypothetical protein